jgi:glycosyltransferase involved in cell wall biosynthesis
MNVLHVIGSLSPVEGGPPEVTRQLARAYADGGDTMEVVCQDPLGSAFLSDMPCRVHALGQRWLGRYGLSPRLWMWLRRNISRFDAVVMQGIWTFPGVAVRLISRQAGKPYGVFPHGALDPWFNQKYPLKHLKKRIYWPIQYAVLRDARAVFFTSKLEPELAKTSFRPHEWNAVIFPNGIYEPGSDRAETMETFYRAYPRLRNRRYFLYLARIHEKKGCDLLLKAFARIAPEQPDLNLVIAGPDRNGCQAALERLAAQLGVAERIIWPGIIADDLKWGALRGAEAFILPSHQENFGVAVVESLAANRPVLISNQVNIWSEIQEAEVGLVDDDTLEGVERLMRKWLAMTPAERDAMSARTYPFFLSHYSMKNGAKAINEVFVQKGSKGARDQGNEGTREQGNKKVRD